MLSFSFLAQLLGGGGGGGVGGATCECCLS